MSTVATYGKHLPAAYFASKCAGHFLVREIALQDDKLAICVFCPGLVSYSTIAEVVYL